MGLTRYIEIPGEAQFDLKLGFVIQREARLRGLDADEIAVKARVGAQYVVRIEHGVAPFAQVHHVMRIAEAMNMQLSTLIRMAETVDLNVVRAQRQAESRIVWAGGHKNIKNNSAVSPTPPLPSNVTPMKAPKKPKKK